MINNNNTRENLLKHRDQQDFPLFCKIAIMRVSVGMKKYDKKYFLPNIEIIQSKQNICA